MSDDELVDEKLGGRVDSQRLRQAILEALAADPADPLTDIEFRIDDVAVWFRPVPSDPVDWEVPSWA